MRGVAQTPTLELLLRVQVDLLGLGNLLENVLDDHTVVHAHIGRRQLDVVVALDNVDIELAI